MSKPPGKPNRAARKATFASTPIGLRELLDASPDVIFCVGVGGEWNWLSPAIEPLAGVKASELIGASCVERIKAEERFRCLRDFARLRRRGPATQTEERTLTMVREDRTECRVAVRVRFIERSDGEPAFIGVMREAHGAPLSWPGLVGPSHAGARSTSGAEGVMAGAPVASGKGDALSASGRLEGLEHHIDDSLTAEFRENEQRAAEERIVQLEHRITELSFELERTRAGTLMAVDLNAGPRPGAPRVPAPGDAVAAGDGAEVQRLEAEIARLKSEVDRLEGEVQRLGAESEEMRLAGVSARAEMVRLRDEAQAAREAADEAVRLAATPPPPPVADPQLTQAEQALAEARELQQQAERAREQAEQMLVQADRARSEERKSRAEAIKARDAAIKARTAAELRTETSLRNEAAAQTRLTEMQSQMAKLGAELTGARETAAQAQAQLGAREAHAAAQQVQELEQRVSALTIELEQARAQAEALRLESEAARGELEAARQEIHSARTDAIAAEAARAAMECEVSRIRAAAESLAAPGANAAPLAPALAATADPADPERMRELVSQVESLERLLEAAEAKGGNWADFISTLSHEIRTPMNGVIGMAHLLLDSGLDPQQRTWVEIIRHSAHALLALINNSLDFSRLETGRIEFEDVDFDLRVTLHEVQNVLAPIAREKHLTITCTVNHEVPSRLRGDAGRLRQVLQNMMGSAIHCSEGGEVRLDVEREIEAEDNVTLRFRITGSGVGASEEHMTNLFQAFAAGDAEVARRFGADGLGLSVARRLVQLLHGQVGLDQNPAVGTMPWFNLPLAKQPEITEQAESTQVRLRGLRALIVDASPASRRAMAEMLTAWGSRAEESANSEEAMMRLEGAAQEGDAFQVAILDMDLPGCSGEVLGGRIRASEALGSTRTMLLTSVGRRGDAARVQGLGFSAYLIKPIQWTELHDALVQVVQNNPAREDAQLVTRHSIAESRRNRARILIVDDDPVNQLVTDWTLRRHGYTTERAGTAGRALEMFDEQRPELVLLDIALPDMDGYKVAQAIRAKEPAGARTPIIAVTGKMMPGDRARCLAAGMDDYLAKPVDLGDLCGAVERWMQRGQKTNSATAPAQPAPTPERIPVIAPPISNEDLDAPILLAAEDDFPAPVRTGAPRLTLVKPSDSPALPVEPARNLAETGDELVLADDVFGGGGAHSAPRLESGPERESQGEFALEKAPDRLSMTGADPNVLDLKRLDDASMGIPALREALLGTFLGDLKPRIERMDQCVLNRNSLKLEHEAHGLKGMAATIGAVGCVAVFQEIERLAHDERFEGMEELIERARQQARKFEDLAHTMNARKQRAA